MLKNSVVFILSNAKYDGLFESTSFTAAKHLAKYNQVFYIEYPATYKDYLKHKKDPDFIKRKNFFSKKSNGLLATDQSNLQILITPLLLSINFLPEGFLYRLLLKYNEALIANRIKKVLKKYKIKDFVFVNSFNIYYPNIGKLIPSALNVYHCVDPLIVGFDRRHGIVSEQIILKNSDLVICTSKQLFVEKQKQHPHTYFVPNAADISHSQKVRQAETQVHPKLKDIKKPIIGYFGNIERRMDYSLLEELFKTNLDKNFVFVGPVTEEFIPPHWYKTANIHFIGRVPFAEMPSILKGFDVAIIPFKKDKVSDTIFPLKLFEYLGSGKPVVSTNFNADLKDFTRNTVNYCADAKEFSEAINDALMNDNLEKQNDRIAVAEENTWEKRMKEFSNLLDQYLKLNTHQ
ncbi:glycosyltransferase [Pedobacter cryophilus]|uniref:Glycosyltransferase family 1 protein n=1 Tax=Pedobacter cryophilus TaxID=2571271 RepID=A0A4U1C1W2_9SPHI|nr:glycosyltransferase [Pedobacter cryophilus]TKB97893.1 glycosyltransferase family 1 protein [Pedobacter cryophilus]